MSNIMYGWGSGYGGGIVWGSGGAYGAGGDCGDVVVWGCGCCEY